MLEKGGWGVHGIICPQCSMDEESINDFIEQSPMWFNKRGRFFNCYYTSVSEIADRFLAWRCGRDIPNGRNLKDAILIL